MRTQVVIIGAGPAGLLLSQLLSQSGIDNLVLERQTREYVEARIRAGVLEPGTVDLLSEAGVGARIEKEGLIHDGFSIAFNDRCERINLAALTGGKTVTIFGQTEITKDLFAIRQKEQGAIVCEAEDVTLHDFDSKTPSVTYSANGKSHKIYCDIIAGCDGFHGVSRASVPERSITAFERIYPVGWLGVLSDTPPVDDELIYVSHERGFALCSMRSKIRSRYYLQCDLDDSTDAWSDARFWDELRFRLPESAAETLSTGPSIEKSIAPLRSFVAEPMRFGQLFLAGDAAHIVPPTGAKGLNLAVRDVRKLWQACEAFYAEKDLSLLEKYSEHCLIDIWRAERFSWWFTSMTHRLSELPFDRRIQLAELDYFTASESGQTTIAENYVGLIGH